MSTTPQLGLPLIAAAQAQKHVTHNEALFALDALVQCAALDKDLSAPPAGPAEGAVYIVGPGPTGEWAGKARCIVVRRDGGWLTIVPKIGFLAYLVDEALLYVFTSAGWSALTDALTAIQNLSRLGLGTSADATNPFAAKLNKALWTARGTGEGGTGDLRYTLSKQSAANVLSLLFQTGHSGRCEIGLVGSDNLVAKVSADGMTWREALSLDNATGALDYLSVEGSLSSAATVDLGSLRTGRILVTGSATIASFGIAANRERMLRFAGALTLIHNATSLILPGSQNLVTSPGDTARVVSDVSGNWRMVAYHRADGRSVRQPIVIQATGGNEAALGTSPDFRLQAEFVATGPAALLQIRAGFEATTPGLACLLVVEVYNLTTGALVTSFGPVSVNHTGTGIQSVQLPAALSLATGQTYRVWAKPYLGSSVTAHPRQMMISGICP